ncbi:MULTISPECIES: hypothetical protein [unclassified Lentimonas]|uniref:hypothetical protein n=1 Tax=unclassified Lentimonas TaxID=2630993 RepID=UPI001328C2DC|nr:MULTISPECIES: hypothetical protein [unclassified Lentimonas]CAA6678063.1 Unannotated [Lentimonas sp. CC4]CAA6687452.1 Unannotated [Lentimonas sp. CC6]CAA7076348.1 Unannotated [Lentimonas sp. CC4]CAA7171994.1 Unannotated [Lentimonas sp. CC21]CAA7180678.1 Unannotated [Lentimonas sp. CC8]
MNKRKIDFSLINHSGKWLIESKVLSYHIEEPATLVLARKNEKSKWLVLAVGSTRPNEDFPNDGNEYREINPFSPSEFDIEGTEAVIRFYTFKALETKKKQGIWARFMEVLNPPVFTGTFTIEGLDSIPEESIRALRDRFQKEHFFEELNLIETPT